MDPGNPVMGLSVMEEAMPKEIIDSKYFGQFVEEGKPVEPTYTHVGWTKGNEHVEIGVVNPEAGEVHSPTAGWFMQLDREGCNRLIRVVRTARDQAFGRDE